MRILILNGPNLNMLGVREPDIYGTKTYEDLKNYCIDCCKRMNADADVLQTNHEGKMVDIIQEAYGVYDCIIINAAAYTHTSVAVHDALMAVSIPTIEVHLSDPDLREEYRKINYIRSASVASFKGLGFESYKKAIEYACNNL